MTLASGRLQDFWLLGRKVFRGINGKKEKCLSKRRTVTTLLKKRAATLPCPLTFSGRVQSSPSFLLEEPRTGPAASRGQVQGTGRGFLLGSFPTKPWTQSADPFLHQVLSFCPWIRFCIPDTSRTEHSQATLAPQPSDPRALPSYPETTLRLMDHWELPLQSWFPGQVTLLLLSFTHLLLGCCLDLSLTPPGVISALSGFYHCPQNTTRGSRSPAHCRGYPHPPQMAHWSLQLHSFPHLPSHYNTTILNWSLDSIMVKLLKFFVILIFWHYLWMSNNIHMV